MTVKQFTIKYRHIIHVMLTDITDTDRGGSRGEDEGMHPPLASVSIAGRLTFPHIQKVCGMYKTEE